MSNDPFYSKPRWRECRADHLRMQPFCVVCLAIGIQRLAVEVDHVVRKERCDPYDHKNLRSLCKTHHGQKTIGTEGQHRHARKRFQVTGADGWPINYKDL